MLEGVDRAAGHLKAGKAVAVLGAGLSLRPDSTRGPTREPFSTNSLRLEDRSAMVVH